jgi:2-oxoglutarate dehydrogenase E1 component
MSPPPCTGVNHSLLKSVGEAITKLPEDFTPHRQIKKIYEARRDMIETGKRGDTLAGLQQQ